MTPSEFEHLRGHLLPAGSFTVSADDNSAVCSALGTEPEPGGEAHPIYAYVATQRGIGAEIGEIFALAEFDVDEGPMLGSTGIVFHSPLFIETEYRVEGEVVDVVRKEGARTGPFDLMRVCERLRAPDRTPAVVVTNSFILPRRTTIS